MYQEVDDDGELEPSRRFYFSHIAIDGRRHRLAYEIVYVHYHSRTLFIVVHEYEKVCAAW